MHEQMLLRQPLMWITIIVLVVGVLWIGSWLRVESAARRASRSTSRAHLQSYPGSGDGEREEASVAEGGAAPQDRPRMPSPHQGRRTSGERHRGRR